MELSMNLTLAIVAEATPDGCHIETLDGRALFARYSRLVLNRIKIRPRQLVAVDEAPDGPQIVWRWFRGPVLLLADGYAVVDCRRFQPGFRYPMEIARVPEHLLDAVAVGEEAFYTHGEEGAIAAAVQDGRPADPGRIAADLFPAIEQVYAEEESGPA
jgi:hypothetical protein